MCVVGALVAVTVMCVLFLVFDLSMLGECEGDGIAGVVMGSEYMDGTHSSGNVSSADDVLEICV